MKKILFLLLIALVLFACDSGSDSTSQEEAFPSWFYNPYGFASLTIGNRSAEVSVQVYDEVEFLDALMQEDVKVIEICSDLNLGAKEVAKKLEASGKDLNAYRNVYRSQREAELHPLLKETGVGRVRLRLRESLMLYSKTGKTIKHAGFEIDEAKDIVIRNLKFSELWEWDDRGEGKYKEKDWDYFVLEKAEGIWFDHLTFEQAYDGIIDVKEGCRNLTLSFSKLEFEPTPFIQSQIEYLEANRELYPYYDGLRNKGLSQDEILKMASFQKKGFNLGNTTHGTGYESITFTFHHLEVKNLQDRMPRIRKGDAHLYQIILDNSGIYDLNYAINPKGVSLVNQGIVTTEQGAVLMENSVFINVANPIKTHQESSNDSKYTGKFKILLSSYWRGGKEHFGSSEGNVPVWTPSNAHPLVPFAFRNYDELPYAYELMDVAFLPEFFEKYPPGAQTLANFDWLKIDTKLHIRGE